MRTSVFLILLLTGCATQQVAQPVLNTWTQLGPDGRVSLRAIIKEGNACPSAVVDGKPLALIMRATASPERSANRGNPAFAPPFDVTSCELSLPISVREAALGGQHLPMPKLDYKRIVVLGDTGCRIRVTAEGKGDPIQDCTNPEAWPWPKIAMAAARTRPDLVIHVGDYHYREYCEDLERCGAIAIKGMEFGYGWVGWDMDFFKPATPLLTSAPWVFVRGNHENCDRGGEGWMRFLSPLPYQPCSNQLYKSPSRSLLTNNLTANAYRIDLDNSLGLIVADNSSHEDFRPAINTPQDISILEQALSILKEAPSKQHWWFFSHRPIWYDLLSPASQPNALQAFLNRGASDKLQLAFGGHQHTFETINFSPDSDPLHHPTGRPAQIIVGGGGTQLESLDPRSPFFEGKTGMGSKERSQPDGRPYNGVKALGGIVLNRYSFLLLERDEQGWNGTVLDPDGLTITLCRLNEGKKAFDCRFPD